jgi:hypothetical protein
LTLKELQFNKFALAGEVGVFKSHRLNPKNADSWLIHNKVKSSLGDETGAKADLLKAKKLDSK